MYTNNVRTHGASMADFDMITYEDEDENGVYSEDVALSMVPDPILIRGTGHITM